MFLKARFLATAYVSTRWDWNDPIETIQWNDPRSTSTIHAEIAEIETEIEIAEIETEIETNTLRLKPRCMPRWDWNHVAPIL